MGENKYIVFRRFNLQDLAYRLNMKVGKMSDLPGLWLEWLVGVVILAGKPGRWTVWEEDDEFFLLVLRNIELSSASTYINIFLNPSFWRQSTTVAKVVFHMKALVSLSQFCSGTSCDGSVPQRGHASTLFFWKLVNTPPLLWSLLDWFGNN